MPELDPFELRIQAGIRAFADRADTRVDAVAVARGAVGRRPVWTVGWAGMRRPVPVLIAVVACLSLVLAGTVLVGALRDDLAPLPPSPSTQASPSATPVPTATPDRVPDGIGPEFATGTATFSIADPGTTGQVGETTQVRGFVATAELAMDDDRVAGTGTLRASVDSSGGVGREWGTYRLEGADGAWEGPVSGAAWTGGDASDLSGFLAGSGAYEGWTFYIHIRSLAFALQVEGIIFPGVPPGSQ